MSPNFMCASCVCVCVCVFTCTHMHTTYSITNLCQDISYINFSSDYQGKRYLKQKHFIMSNIGKFSHSSGIWRVLLFDKVLSFGRAFCNFPLLMTLVMLHFQMRRIIWLTLILLVLCFETFKSGGLMTTQLSDQLQISSWSPFCSLSCIWCFVWFE